MPDQQTQQAPQPPMSEERLNKLLGPGGLSFLQTLARDGGSEFKFDKGGKFSMSYDPREVMGQSQQALSSARQQAGPASYAALDPQEIIALMGQSQQTDQMAQQIPQMLSQMGLQGAQAQNLQGTDNRNALDALAMLAGRAMSEQGMNERSQAQMDDRFVNRLAADKTAEQRNRDIIASREKVARIMTQAQQEKRIPSLLDLQDSFNMFQFNKKGEYVQPEPSDMKVLDRLYQQHGWDILEIPLGEYAPLFSGNQPPQNVYFAVPQGGKPSETEVMQKLTKMGYKGLVPADLKKLVR